jgi:hypothetical protein
MLRRLLVLLLIALATAAPAFAGDVQVTLGLTSGKLQLRAPAAAATAAHAVQVPVLVADGRGKGTGWTLRLASPHAVVTSITARCAAGSTCTLPRAATDASGAMILRAARDTGMGVIQLVVTIAPLAPGSAAAPLAFSVS